MAFYGFHGDADSCYWTPYSSTYDCGATSISFHDSSHYQSGESQYSCRDYSFTESNYSPISFHDSSHYQSGESQYSCRDYSFTESNYSADSCSDPRTLQYDPFEYHRSQNYYYLYPVNPPQLNYGNLRFLQYEPPVSDRGYFPSETTFRVTYSVSEFNETEFAEYDPTPYGGGYDIATTYGKPLPPSDFICHPRTLPKSDSPSFQNSSYGSIPSPYGKGDDLPKKPPNGGKPVDAKPELGVGGKSVGVGSVESPEVLPTHDSDRKNGMRGDHGYGSEAEKAMGQIPYGSGLESLDLCESIFGYWPCLAEKERRETERRSREACDQEGSMDPWRTAADYLFGSPVVYGYGYDDNNHQPQYGNPWLQ